jgi:hypothetical protein
MMINMRSMKRTLMGIVLLALLAAPQGVMAQTGGITIAVNGCDSSNYPDIVCMVTPVNSAGVPLQNLDATSFQVVDGSTTIADIQVQRVVSPSLKASVLLLVDFGMIRQGEALQPLKDSSKSILQAASNDDRLAVIAITGPVNVDTKLNPETEYGFAPASEKRNDMISLISKLNAVGHTPLYDSVCKALIVAAQENVGRRAVIVLSDGADVGSTACNDSDTFTRANKDRTPVFTIGVGPDLKEGYLRKLATQTGGQYESAVQLQNVLEIFKRMESNLRTQYQVMFHMNIPGDGQAKTVDIRVSQSGNTATDKATFVTAAPIKPTFSKVTFTIDGAVVNPKLLPANKTVIIEPKIDSAKPVKAVEYIVAGNSTKETTPPFQFVIASNDLNGVNKITLKAAGEEGNLASVTVYDVQVAIDPASLVQTPTPTPQPSLLQQLTTFPGILIVVVFIGALILLVLLIVLLSRRQAQRNVRYIPDSPPTMVTPVAAFDDNAAVPQSSMGQVSFPTKMFSDPVPQNSSFADGQPAGTGTIMFKAPVAILELTNGDAQRVGKRFDIGSTGMDVLSIGRDPESGPGAVRVVSQFVSRKHARISVEGGVIYVTDLNSASGTRLNGERLIAAQRRVIKVGDKIDFGDVSAEIKQV